MKRKVLIMGSRSVGAYPVTCGLNLGVERDARIPRTTPSRKLLNETSQ